MRKLLVLAAMAYCALGSASAEIYKCVEAGKTIFQDQPCRNSGSAITVKPNGNILGDSSSSSPATSSDKGPAIDQSSLAKAKAQVKEMEQARRKREIDDEIEKLQSDIRGYEQASEAELAILRSKKSYANYNLPGAIWERKAREKSISTEMRAVSDKYQTRIQVARDKIAQLRKDAAEIGKNR